MAGCSECDLQGTRVSDMPGKISLGEGLVRGGRRAAIHMLKAGVELLRGVEGFFEELSTATRSESSDEDPQGPKRIPLD